ncbi:MAG: helix-turn-helix transcriptional regulator, partial [Gallionellaceae bacterium]|nr:helix-turn-helix transcriptional regulator [Gallionellaceae bacterium]
EQQISRLEKLLPQKVREQAEPEAKSGARFTAKGFKTLRKRLGLTAEATAALLGVTAQTIYNWEAGNSSPRDQQMVRIVMLRGMGKKEVGAILQNLAG